MSALCSTLWILISFFRSNSDSDHPHSSRTSETCLSRDLQKYQISTHYTAVECTQRIGWSLFIFYDCFSTSAPAMEKATVQWCWRRESEKNKLFLLLIFIDLIFTQSANCEIKYLPFFHLYIDGCVRWDLHESAAAKCRERKTKNNEINQLSMERVREVFLQLAKRTEEVTNFFLSFLRKL